jgi:hypothetical protein
MQINLNINFALQPRNLKSRFPPKNTLSPFDTNHLGLSYPCGDSRGDEFPGENRQTPPNSENVKLSLLQKSFDDMGPRQSFGRCTINLCNTQLNSLIDGQERKTLGLYNIYIPLYR